MRTAAVSETGESSQRHRRCSDRRSRCLTSATVSQLRADPIDVSVQLIRIDADRVVLIARDITERTHTQQEKEILYRKAVDAVRARDEFLSVASHELRTPLSALQLQIQTLQTTRRLPRAVLSPEQMQPKLEMAQRQIERLTRLVGELMDVSRITAGRFRIQREDVDLAAIVRDVGGRLGEEARRSNSSVTVRAAAIGIAIEDVERIFQRYEHAISSRAFGGLELGLYIARQIIDAHGGSIWVESQPGAGSAFTVDLPRSATTRNHATAGREGMVTGHHKAHPDR